MTQKNPDDNDLAIAGQLPEDPEEGTVVIDDGPRVVTVRDLLRGAYQRATKPRQKRSLTTGSHALDKLTGGMRPGITWVLMGNTSFGKTSKIISMADENLKRGARALIISTEDAPEMYGNRLLARRGKLNAIRVRDGTLTPEETKRALAEVNSGEPIPVYLDAIGKPAEWILKQVPLIVKAHGIDIAFLDYIQEVDTLARHESRQLELQWIGRQMRACFKRLKIPGVIVSQITPKQGERPTKEDVRQCKDIVHGAEVVAIGYEPTRDLETKSAGTIEAGTKCLLIDKNKDGPKGVVPLKWDEDTASFYDATDPMYDGMTDMHERLERDGEWSDLDA